jgi:hypothetical protein
MVMTLLPASSLSEVRPGSGSDLTAPSQGLHLADLYIRNINMSKALAGIAKALVMAALGVPVKVRLERPIIQSAGLDFDLAWGRSFECRKTIRHSATIGHTPNRTQMVTFEAAK